ncbi:hypothetical protein O7606_00155 [Micromonospora sp. WMMD882]|uniref:hypothetical protein n=1 Tax=Micromonospora sp. WMMD882 TaxID=3015151 RepID=UPI00248D2396|nr:hypothetical protein [Micromonospora sp. WMMD882]WBB79864.1 hypothetical protein O7606_00155 [Micromonospora sp. WMMD882]
MRVLLAGVGAVMVLGAAAVAGARWHTAGEPVPVAPPPGSSTTLPEGSYETVVDNGAAEVSTDLRTGRGGAEVRTYALPAAATWDQVRSGVAGQLDGWRQVGDCADTGDRRVRCSWSEPTRWWPRRVRIVFLRPAAPGDADSYPWPDNTFLVIGAARGG